MKSLDSLAARCYGVLDLLRRKILPESRTLVPDAFPKRGSLAECLAGRYTHGIVHVGLSAVAAGSAREAADLILGDLESALTYFAVPAFTPGFRKTRSFSVVDSLPEVGGFSKICAGLKPPRTADPIHSLYILGRGGGELLSDPVRDTFAPEGVYRRFSEPGSCWINIGTPHIIATVFHYVERIARVPYVGEEVIEGRIVFPGGREETVRQTNYRRRFRAAWNRGKIEESLKDAGALETYAWRGATVRVIDGNLAVRSLLAKLGENPYFMVTQ